MMTRIRRTGHIGRIRRIGRIGRIGHIGHIGRIGRIGWVAVGLALTLSCAVAKADVVAVVSAKSPITTLSMSQVAEIFLGKVSRYPNGLQAFPIDQAEDSAIRDEFYSKVVGRTAMQVKAYWARIIFTGRGQPPPTVSGDLEMRRRISENSAAIGYIDRSVVDASVRVVF
jgi:ABC-type phosphate transport system substrate-binding protein